MGFKILIIYLIQWQWYFRY